MPHATITRDEIADHVLDVGAIAQLLAVLVGGTPTEPHYHPSPVVGH
jgi:hypothetical protein